MPASSSTSRTRAPAKKVRKKPQRLSSRVRKDRSYRQVIGRVDVWSVLKVSLCFHTAAMLMTVVAMMCGWWVAGAVGLIKNLEKLMGTVFEIHNFSFAQLDVLVGVILIGLVLVALMTILSVIAAALYNVFAEAVGGVEVYVVEETVGSRI